jgi:DNA-directed RNA polymerase subunit E'/Rpb7
MQLHTLVVLYPWQLNNELYLHLKNNLKQKIENKCIDAGYVYKINNIEKYNIGYILPEDLTGNTIFEITYTAKICNPMINNQMICKIDKFLKYIM